MGSPNTGDPAKIVIKPLTYLKKTILDMNGAKNRLTNMINGDLKGVKHLTSIELATLEETIKSIDSGLGYLNALEYVFNETGIVDMRSK